MSLTETLRIALRALAANKLRSILTMLGMIIGVAAVIALMSVGRGVENYVTRTFQGIGSNLLFVIPGGPGQVSLGPGGFRRREKPLTMDDVRILSDPARLPDVVAVAPAVGDFANVEFGRENSFVQVLGVPPNYADVANYSVNDGDWLSDNDERGAARVAVLGQTVVKRLFRDELPLGQTVKINQVPFRVIGTLTPRGGGLFGDQDNVVFIPLSTAQQRVYNLRTADGKLAVSNISLQVRDAGAMDSTAQQVTEVLRDFRGITFRAEDDFTVVTQQDLISSFGQITSALTLFLGLIAGISLLVGGIGIMNIMLVSVTERTREIGLRKALGAKRRDVLNQFLVEAVSLSALGGLIGIAIGAGLGALIQFIQPDLPVAVTPDSVALATGVSLAIGLFFGLYPAWRAAQLNPIEALRYE